MADSPGGGQEQPVQYHAPQPIYFIVVAMLIGLLTRTVTGAWPRRLPALPVPFTGLMFVWGALVGLANNGGAHVNHISEGIAAWENISPDLIFAVFLPVLVFESALSMEWHKVKRLWTDVLLLAIPGTLYNAALITFVARWVLPYGWSWSEASLFGAIVSAIDPIAVVAVIKSVSASATLGTVIEGESLLNDGVAFVLYEIFRKWQAGDNPTAGGVVGFTFQAVFGGAGLGLAFGLSCTAWLTLLFEDSVGETWLMVVTSYSLFLLSDEVLNTSGILALVFCGLFMCAVGQHRISHRAAPNVFFFWDWANWTANTLIFFLSGAIIAAETYQASPSILAPRDWGYAVALWLLLVAIRGSMVLIFYPLLSRLGYGLSWRDGIVLTWAGLRGSVGLVLALSVLNAPELGALQYRTLVFFFMGLQSALTLLIQGTTTQPLLRLLGYLKLSAVQKDAMRHAAYAVEEYGREVEEEELVETTAGPQQDLLGQPDWGKVEKLSSLKIVKLVERRPERNGRRGHKRKRQQQGETAPPPAGPGESQHKGQGSYDGDGDESEDDTDHQAQLRDIRSRLLGVARSGYTQMFTNKLMPAAVFTVLLESVEAALDDVDEGLCDWRHLKAGMPWLDRMERLDRWLSSGRCARLLYMCRRSLVRPLLKTAASREVGSTVAFIQTHRYARAQLNSFETIEEDLEAGSSDLDSPGGGSTQLDGRLQSGQRQLSKQQRSDSQQPPVTPFWLGAGAGQQNGYQILAEVMRRIHTPRRNGHHDNNGPSASFAQLRGADCQLRSAIAAALAQVLAESEAEEREACAHLKSLKERHPDAACKVATVEAAVVLLDQKQHFLQQLLSAGVLEQREVEKVMGMAARRMKYIHVRYRRQ